MRKWQILEFDGKPYYAFVPENVTPLDENVLSESEEQIDPDIKLEKPQAIKYKEDSLDSFPVDETYEDEDFEEMMEEDEEEEEEEERVVTVKQTRSRTKASAAQIKVEDMILDLDAAEMEDSVGYLIDNYDDESSPEKASSSEASCTLKCKVCSETFASNLLFRKHVAWIHKKKVYIKEDNVFVCCVCDYQTNKKNLFALHLQRKHKNLTTNKQTGNVFPCAACGFECRSKHSLQSHFIRKHTDRYEHQCKFCTKQFKVKGDLTNHVRFHHKEKPINCDVCGKLCLNSGSLYVHQKWAHYKPKFECPICKRRMVTQENLDQHMVSQHEKREKIVCAECGKTFSKKDSFKRHMAVHTGSKPHCCVICQKHFARRSQLRQHLLIHTGKKPFVCDICGKAFTQKPGLICHRKIHPGPHPPLPVMPIGDIVKEFTEGYYADPFNQEAEAEQDSE